MFQLLEYDLPVLTLKDISLYSHVVESSPRLAAESTGWVGAVHRAERLLAECRDNICSIGKA